MKNRKILWKELLRPYRLSLVCVALVLTIMQTQVTEAASFFHDVNEQHWAHAAISYVADRGYMPGNTMGYFNPDIPLDYFEASQIMARVAGFSHTGLTDEQRDYIDNAYLRNRWVLAPYEEAYRLWNTASGREITFLLERGILEPKDLELFVVRHYNEERLRNLSYETAETLLLRLMGENSLDNHNYYSFNPEHEMSRAAFAVWLKSAIVHSSNGVVAQVETIMAVFEQYHQNFVQLLLPDGQSEMYLLSDSATIRIEGRPGNASDLIAGMHIIAVALNDSELIVLEASAHPFEVVNSTYPPVTGTVHGIFISADAPYIILRCDDDNQLTMYPVNKDSVDMYSLRLGNRVSLRLYSLEVQSLTILNE